MKRKPFELLDADYAFPTGSQGNCDVAESVDIGRVTAAIAEDEDHHRIVSEKWKNRCEELRAEVEKLRISVDTYNGIECTAEDLQVENEKLQEMLKINVIETIDLRKDLIEAIRVIEFYASQWRCDVYVGPSEDLLKDAGDKARKFLEKS